MVGMSRGTIRLSEYVHSGDRMRVDEEAGVLRGVKVLGLHSRNGRRYLPEAVERARPLYEGRAVNVDHRRSASDPRSSYDRFGWLESVRVEQGGLYADLHYLKSHPLAGPVVEAARRRPDLFGLSHDATGRERAGSNGSVIESIDDVSGVDVVSDPATAKSLFESTGSHHMSTPAAKKLREVLAQKLRDPAWRRLVEAMDPACLDHDADRVPGAAGLDMAPDLPAETPADAGPRAHGRELLTHICDSIEEAMAGADGSTLDPEYKDLLDQVLALCRSHESMSGAAEGAESKPEGAVESKKPARPAAGSRALQEEVERLKKRDHVRDLCAEAGFPATALQVKALCALDGDGEVKALLEQWRGAGQPQAGKSSGPRSASRNPGTPPARPAREEAPPADAKTWLEGLDRRARDAG